MKQNYILSALLVFVVVGFISPFMCKAQSDATVEAKGVGALRDEALQDAMRNAVSQAMGAHVTSETEVENFMVIRDAIRTRSNGYIAKYDVLTEGLKAGLFEMTIRATVSLQPLKADARALASALGGLRFLVMYDKRASDAKLNSQFNFATERVNEYLSQKNYRYIEKSRFETLIKESSTIFESESTDQMTYIQRLGLKANAQFIMLIQSIRVESKSESFDTRTSSRVILEVKAFDNCTAEGLGTVVLKSSFKSAYSEEAGIIAGIQEAIQLDFDKLLSVFNNYMGEWINNGTPYEVRFYNAGSFREFRAMRDKMKSDKYFAGQYMITSVDNYTKINCTYKMKPDDLAYAILDYADEIPELKSKLMDVKLIYGRQINIAPKTVKIKSIE